MVTTTLDILYLVLAVGFGMLLLSLTYLVIRFSQTVARTNKIMEIVEESADTVNEYIKLPGNIALTVSQWVKNADLVKYYEWFQNRRKAKTAKESDEPEERPASRKSKKKRKR